MGLFDFMKKKAPAPQQQPKANIEQYDRLTSDGDLPFGWVTKNKEFCDKINSEYSYFLHTWLDSRKMSLMEQYQALKSFILYLEDVERLCKSKGECFEFWFREVLTSEDYIDMRKKELEKLQAKIN